MIRNLMATTALAALVATGAYAQDTMTPTPAPADPAPMEDAAPTVQADGHLATQIIGENVYNGTGDDAAHIGDVNDIVIGQDGKIQAVVVGVGGFLGIGQKNVAVDFAELDWAERDGNRWLVAPTTKEALEQQPAFDASAYEPAQTAAATDPAMGTGAMDSGTMGSGVDTAAPAPAAPATDMTAQAPAEPAPAPEAVPGTEAPGTEAQVAPAPEAGTDTTTTAAIDRSTLTEMPASEIRAEDMIGTTVYGADDTNVGEIGDVVLSTDGNIDAYLVDVGGFLGIGAKEVAVGGDNLAFMTDSDGNKYLYTTFTKEQLEAAAAYDEGTYAERREDQRLIVR